MRKSLREVELERQIRELIETIDAIRNGEIDGLIVSAPEGEQIFTLESAEHPYRVLVEEMGEGAVTLIEGNFIAYANRSFATLIDQPLETIVGRGLSSVLGVSNELNNFLSQAWTMRSSRCEIRLQGLEAGKPFLLSASAVAQRGINSLCVIVTDLSEQKRAEQMHRERTQRLLDVERLQAERHIAETANRAKSDFLANMSHEIRTPLGAILGFAQLLADPNQTLADRQDCVATILRNGALLARVINEVLDLSKIESDKMEIEQVEFDINQLIGDVMALMRLQAEEKGLSLKLTQLSKLPAHLISDPTRVRQILFNIIGNAIKFTSSGRIEVRVSFEDRAPGVLRFDVSDTGSGLSQSQRERIFQPFMQADNTMTRKHGGTGLGLYLSRKLANALGGDIAIVDSEPGVGTVFSITLAAQPVWTISTPTESLKPIQQSRSRLSGISVLVVDDAPDNRILVSRFLKAEGAQIECASGGLEGIEKASSCHFDVVLMDIQMPGLDGFEAIGELKKMAYSRPVVALTAHAMKGDRDRCIAAGFNDHLVKPIDREQLISVVAAFAGSTGDT